MAKKSHFKPGTLGCHEALHMASFLADAVQVQLADHPAIKQNPEWRTIARDAASMLGELYQKIGRAHL